MERGNTRYAIERRPVGAALSLRGRFVGWCALLLLCAAAQAQDPSAVRQAEPLPEIIVAIDTGKFQQATSRIDAALQQEHLPDATRQALEFQRERMRRMRIDFGLDRSKVMARIRQQIPDLSDKEFDRWDAAGSLEHLDIDGTRYYFNRSASNLYRVNTEAAARRVKPVKPNTDGPFEHLHPHHSEALQQAQQSGATSVAPRRLQVTQSLTVDADAVPAGETIRAWIPYPRAIKGQQEDIRLIASQPANAQVAPETTLQRTAYLEQKAQAGQPTEFSVTYELTIYARYFDIDPEQVVAAPLTEDLAPYVQERAPHIVFTDAIKAFSLKVVGTETNPYRIAQKLFAAVDKTPWAGAREYSTISNISDYALHAGHADCGQQTLLLMTLLRYNGIPARWQSGWTYSDESVGYDNMHDWGWVYLAPYGWVPMDVTTGQLDSDNPELRWFYLGGLDAYRITFNDDFSRELVPAKQHFRSETVDSQRGEAEWSGGNLYFDQWDYDFKWKMLPVKSSK